MNFLFFAQFDQDPDNFALELGRMSPQARERLLVLGAIGLVIVLMLVWAAFFRKRPRHKRGHIKHDRHSLGKSLAEGWGELRRIFAQRERERKRIRHRPRNPTRAEVGGLPGIRGESDGGAEDSPPARSNL